MYTIYREKLKKRDKEDKFSHIQQATSTEIMRASGMSMTTNTLRAGLQQGVFPFDDYIEREKGPVYHINKKLFDRWMAERAVENGA